MDGKAVIQPLLLASQKALLCSDLTIVCLVHDENGEMTVDDLQRVYALLLL